MTKTFCDRCGNEPCQESEVYVQDGNELMANRLWKGTLCKPCRNKLKKFLALKEGEKG